MGGVRTAGVLEIGIIEGYMTADPKAMVELDEPATLPSASMLWNSDLIDQGCLRRARYVHSAKLPLGGGVPMSFGVPVALDQSVR